MFLILFQNYFFTGLKIKNLYCKSNQIIRKLYKCYATVKNELFRIYASNIYCLGLLAKFKYFS